jgi:hypothetical protein
MATTTTNFSWQKPTVDGDTGVWGGMLNSNWDDADTEVFARLLKSGGAMTGRLDLFSATSKLIALGSISGATDVDLATGNVFSATITGATTFSFINPPSGTWLTGFVLVLTNAGANVTWPVSVDWPGGTEPTLTVTGVDVLVFFTINNGTTWRGALSMSDSS